MSKSYTRSLQIRMAVLRTGDFCSDSPSEKDQGHLSLWLRWHVPVWSPQCGSNGGVGGVVGEGSLCGHNKHSISVSCHC